jgi:hypothetical protein
MDFDAIIVFRVVLQKRLVDGLGSFDLQSSFIHVSFYHSVLDPFPESIDGSHRAERLLLFFPETQPNEYNQLDSQGI